MPIEKMRKEVEKVYGKAWVKKKSDDQIIAIYHSLVKRGTIKKQRDPYENNPYFRQF